MFGAVGTVPGGCRGQVGGTPFPDLRVGTVPRKPAACQSPLLTPLPQENTRDLGVQTPLPTPHSRTLLDTCAGGSGVTRVQGPVVCRVMQGTGESQE